MKEFLLAHATVFKRWGKSILITFGVILLCFAISVWNAGIGFGLLLAIFIWWRLIRRHIKKELAKGSDEGLRGSEVIDADSLAKKTK